MIIRASGLLFPWLYKQTLVIQKEKPLKQESSGRISLNRKTEAAHVHRHQDISMKRRLINVSRLEGPEAFVYMGHQLG
jgi:hypothetical protein